MSNVRLTEHCQQLLINVINSIRAYMKAPPMTWDDGRWSRKVIWPPMLQCQLDGWSCGLFLLMAITALAKNAGWESVINDNKEKMREVTIQALLTIP